MKFLHQNIIAIIPASGKPTNKIMNNSNLPDTMLPINGKPVIGYIIEDLLKRSIKKAAVILNKDDNYTEKYITKKFGSKCALIIIYNDNYERGLGYSICLTKSHISESEGTLIYLGDTIYKGPLKFDSDFLVVSKKYESTEKWCFIEKEKNKLCFINKPQDYKSGGKILCGIYFFTDTKVLAKNFDRVEKSEENIELSDILNEYSKTHEFTLINAKKWYDCGNIENFHKAKIDFLKVRNFNSIAYDDLRGQITKSSKNKEKIFNEINWFKNIPVDLQIFTPRLIDNKTTRDVASYSLEFYGYQSLADFFVFGSLYPQIWHNIINKLLDIINLFRTHKAYLPYSYYHDIYYKKTLERLEKMETDRSWKKLKEQNEIFINGRKYNNINHFIKLLEKAVKKLYIKKEMTFIHGDLCLSNILFDPINRIFKFIDPRGHFGVASIYGDIKYDIAKLRHSFSGFYDFIISDTFEFKEESDSSFIFHNHTEKIHHEIADYFDAQLIKRGYDLEQIKLIEALLFLSMTPLHDDHPARQKAMYLTGIILINQTKI